MPAAILGGGVVACVAAGIGYQKSLRQSILNWGSTPAEVGAALPGDELMPHPDRISTRSITIDAAPSGVYPWLVQMGPAPRGGAYTYDWIENLLGLDMHSADHIIDEFTDPHVGDEIGLGPNTMRVALVETDHAFATRSADGNWVWSFTLQEGPGTTRLISRNLFRLPRWIDRIGMIPMEPGSLVMERKMLLGIKHRAERQSSGT